MASAYIVYCCFLLTIHKDNCMQAFNMSKDHKPELKSEKDRIYAAGGYIYGGRVNRTLNLARAIGRHNCLS